MLKEIHLSISVYHKHFRNSITNSNSKYKQNTMGYACISRSLELGMLTLKADSGIYSNHNALVGDTLISVNALYAKHMN